MVTVRASASPAQRTVIWFKEVCNVKLYAHTEWFVKHPGGPGYKVDLFGFVDHVFDMDGKIAYVQSTSYSNMSSRCKKIAASPRCVPWAVALLHAEQEIMVFGWHGDQSGEQRRREVRIAEAKIGGSGPLLIGWSYRHDTL